MAKKQTALTKLAKAVEPLSKKQNRGNSKPPQNPPPEAYRFKPGQSGNPSGRPKDHARETLNRLAHTSPPKKLCEQIGIEPNCTWVEAIVFSLAKAAASGDVSAAREVLANLGLRGSVAASLVAINTEDPERMGLFATFCKHIAGIPIEDYPRIWTFMESLVKPALDGDCLPPPLPAKKQLDGGKHAAH